MKITKVRTVFTLLLASLTLTSCEYFYHAEIKNESEKPILIKVKFNKIALEKYWKGRSYLPFLASYPNYTNISSVSFDTVNLVKTYIVAPAGIFPLESGMDEPNFEILRSLSVLGQDTILLTDKKDIKKAFHQTNKYVWVLTVK